MEFEIDKEYREVAANLHERFPFLEGGVPSMYSKDGKYLYLKSLDDFVGSESHDLAEVEILFWEVVRRRKEGVSIQPLTAKLKKEYQLAFDQALLARWVRDHFYEQADPELIAALDSEPEATG